MTFIEAGTRVFVLVTRRAEIFTVRDSNGCYELPGCVASGSESVSEVLSRILSEISGGNVCAIGEPIAFSMSNAKALCFPVLTQKSMFDNFAASELGLGWLSKSECERNPQVCAEALGVLRSDLPEDAGNSYALGHTAHGIPTFFHLATGETLHGQAGPWEEAQNLYIPLSQLRTRSGNVVVHDMGLGCGTLSLAVLDAFVANNQLQNLTLLSYDLEINGIAALLQNLEEFSFAIPFRNLLETFLRDGIATLETPDGRTAIWRFLQGDFVKKSQQMLPENEKAHVIFFDFFSPKSHPPLWTYQVFLGVFANAASDAVLITSSSATATRAALAAVGFFVGLAPASGKRAHSTIASRQLSDLESPLPANWIQRFSASHVPFCEAETEDAKQTIRERVLNHPQFFVNSKVC